MWCLYILIIISVLNTDGKLISSESLDPEWQNLLNAGGMHIGHGRTKRFVELKQNQPNQPHQACLLPNGKGGHCRYLHYCIQEDFKKDFMKFMDYLCIIKHSAIGVCCSDGIVEGGTDALAGDLPATAQKDENAIVFKVKRAENRGCGLSTREGRMTESRLAYAREWPWMALVSPEEREPYCGGVLITDRHVLTAAHCTREWKPKQLSVRLGEYDLKRTNDSRSYNFRVIEIRQHEEFDSLNYHNDIAILKLHRAAVFNTYVWPICLPPPGLELEDKLAIVIGWGTTSYGGISSDVLMEVAVPVWNYKECVESIRNTVFNDTLCAGGKQGGQDSCQYDSGGPLMYQLPSGRWVVIGIVSWGESCGELRKPGIYTRVDMYLDWIHRNAIF